MTLALSTRIARRELRGGLRGFRIFLACLALGVAAIAGVGSVRSGIEAGLAAEGAAILGGDAEMEFTYRFADPEERAWMEDTALAVSEIADFRSMAVQGDTRALTQVKAVDDAYPLVGNVALAPDMPLAEALAGRDDLPGAVMAPILIAQMELAMGDTFRLGTQDFVLMAALENEPDSAGDSFALGPRTLVLREALETSGLLASGTLFSSKYRLALPANTALAPLESEA
jgi:putative ABC transport system permease protein